MATSSDVSSGYSGIENTPYLPVGDDAAAVRSDGALPSFHDMTEKDGGSFDAGTWYSDEPMEGGAEVPATTVAPPAAAWDECP